MAVEIQIDDAVGSGATVEEKGLGGVKRRRIGGADALGDQLSFDVPAIHAFEFAGVEEFSLGIDPEGMIGAEKFAELLWRYGMKGGDFRQALSERCDGCLAPRFCRELDARGESRLGCLPALAGQCGGQQQDDGGYRAVDGILFAHLAPCWGPLEMVCCFKLPSPTCD